MTHRTIILAGVFYAGAGVVLGAWGAHGLAQVIGNDPGKLSTWDTGVLYQLVHGLALLALGIWGQLLNSQNQGSAWLGRAAGSIAAGVLLFSGSLYVLVLGGPSWLGPVTPLGGLLLIGGWLCAGLAALKLNDL